MNDFSLPQAQRNAKSLSSLRHKDGGWGQLAPGVLEAKRPRGLGAVEHRAGTQPPSRQPHRPQNKKEPSTAPLCCDWEPPAPGKERVAAP